MTTTENENERKAPARRVKVTHEPVPGSKPWRAVLAAVGDDLPYPPDIAVGRFDTMHEAATTGVSALRFIDAGVRWVPVGEPEVEQ